MYVVIVIYGDHRNIHVPKHSFPTRRSSEHADSVPCSFGSTTLTTSRDMPTRLVAIVIPARIIARWNAVDGAAAPALVIDTCYFPCIACCSAGYPLVSPAPTGDGLDRLRAGYRAGFSRSEARRVGKECAGKCSFRGLPTRTNNK